MTPQRLKTVVANAGSRTFIAIPGFNPIHETVYATLGYVLGYTVRNDDGWYTRSANRPVCSSIRY
jgi:hypothetical protein